MLQMEQERIINLAAEQDAAAAEDQRQEQLLAQAVEQDERQMLQMEQERIINLAAEQDGCCRRPTPRAA